MRNKLRARRTAAGALVLCLACACLGLGMREIVRDVTMSPLRKALPPAAQDIHEWSWDEGGLLAQDYDYVLKAKITQSEFDQYVRDQGLSPHTPARQYSGGFEPDWDLSWLWRLDNNGVRPDWWSPSTDVSGTYVYDGGSLWTYAKYEDGYLYLVSYNI